MINDKPIGRSIDEILRLVQASQYTDETGEEVHFYNFCVLAKFIFIYEKTTK